MKADNQMKNDHEIEVSKALGNLPLELRAMNEAMNMVFGAVIAAPREAKSGSASGTTCKAPGVAAPRRIDIENAIMRAPGFDYLLASEIFAALQRRLELRYENLNPQVEEAMQRLAKSFDHVTG